MAPKHSMSRKSRQQQVKAVKGCMKSQLGQQQEFVFGSLGFCQVTTLSNAYQSAFVYS